MPNIDSIEGLIRTPDLSTKGIVHAFANVTASQTDSEVVGAVTNNKIRVLAFYTHAGGTATNLTFNSSSSAISPLFANGANGGATLSFNPTGWFETVSGEALTVTTGSGSTTGILVVYAKVRTT